MLDKRLQPAWDLLTEAGASFPDLETRLHACEVIARALETERRRAEAQWAGTAHLPPQAIRRHVAVA